MIVAIFGVALLGLSLALPMELGREREPGWQLPIVWFVMPWTAWLSTVSVTVVLARLAQTILSLTIEERTARIKSATAWALVGMLGFFLFKRAGDSVEILRGAIPIKPTTGAFIILLAAACIFAMVLSSRAVLARKRSKAVATHVALVVGSVIFGVPFLWLLVTSFKEDRDMVSTEGLVWVPRVSQTALYMDEENPLIEATFDGRTVYGYITEKFSDGSAKIEIDRPGVLRGWTVKASTPLKKVPKDVPLMTFQQDGKEAIGMVIKELNDTTRRIKITSPSDLAGQIVEKKIAEIEPYRKVGLRLQNYSDALDFLPLETNRGLVYVKNTLILVIFNVLGTVLISSIVAYAFARMRFPGKGLLFALLLSTMMLPGAVTLLPQFLIYRSLGWVDTLLPLWVPAFFGSAFNIFLLRQFFMGVPMELEDAAKIDGCSYLRSFWQVMMPQVKPALTVIAIWTFIGAWNNFMGPLVYISSPEKMPVAYAIQLFQSDRSGEPGLLMAFATMGMLPVLALFFAAQKYFIEGVTLSGLGGR